MPPSTQDDLDALKRHARHANSFRYSLLACCVGGMAVNAYRVVADEPASWSSAVGHGLFIGAVLSFFLARRELSAARKIQDRIHGSNTGE